MLPQRYPPRRGRIAAPDVLDKQVEPAILLLSAALEPSVDFARLGVLNAVTAMPNHHLASLVDDFRRPGGGRMAAAAVTRGV